MKNKLEGKYNFFIEGWNKKKNQFNKRKKNNKEMRTKLKKKIAYYKLRLKTN
jgi:hypothetical protein